MLTGGFLWRFVLVRVLYLIGGFTVKNSNAGGL